MSRAFSFRSHSNTLTAIASPSKVLVPRPSSSMTIKLWLVACVRIVFVSSISQKNVDFPLIMLSLAPSRVNILSTGESVIDIEGTNVPIWASITASAIDLINVDFPPILGPLSKIDLCKSTSLGMKPCAFSSIYSFAIFSKWGVNPTHGCLSCSIFNIGEQELTNWGKQTGPSVRMTTFASEQRHSSSLINYIIFTQIGFFDLKWVKIDFTKGYKAPRKFRCASSNCCSRIFRRVVVNLR